MKRSHFIASIAAILLAPFVKTRPKEVLDQFGLDRKSGNPLWNGPAQSEDNGLLFGQKTEYSAIHGKWVNGKWSVEYIKASKEDALLDRYLQYLSNLE